MKKIYLICLLIGLILISLTASVFAAVKTTIKNDARDNLSLAEALLGYWVCSSEMSEMFADTDSFYFDNTEKLKDHNFDGKIYEITKKIEWYSCYYYITENSTSTSDAILVKIYEHHPQKYLQEELITILKLILSKDKNTFTIPPEDTADNRTIYYNYKGREMPTFLKHYIHPLSSISSTVNKTKSKKKIAANSRKINSLHQAYKGHWKIEGKDNDGNWTDYYVTDSTFQMGNMLEGTYYVISENIDKQTMLIEETTNIIGANIPPITNQTAIIFSADYKSAILISNPGGKVEGGNYYGPEKHRLKYIGQK